MVQLGADRRYTGPDCPPEMLEQGGIPQGDCAPMPWMLSSRGYGVIAHTYGNGTRFDMSTDRTSVSTRALAGPLVLEFMCQSTPAARLRALCRQTGFPMLLPEWGYGFWKSRDVHEDREAVIDDYDGFRRHEIPLDAIVIDSPWATQYNSWEINPHQLPEAEAMIRGFRADGVRTVLWCTPWVNIDSRDGQMPPQPESERLHREPASNYAPGALGGHFVRQPDGDEPWVGQWWMGTGSIVDFTSDAAEQWWREQVKDVLSRASRASRWTTAMGTTYRTTSVWPMDAGAQRRPGSWVDCTASACSERSMRSIPEPACSSGAPAGSASTRWATRGAPISFRLLVAARARDRDAVGSGSGISNWSHDIGGYLGHRLVERCPPELFIRWLQFGCFTPLMHAHSRFPHEPWNYGQRMVDTYRAYVLLHEQLVPYTRAAAATAARAGLPIIRPLCLIDADDPRGWELTDAYGYGPALWVAPVLDDGAREREVLLPRGDWIETWSGPRVHGGVRSWCPRRFSRFRSGCGQVRSSSPTRLSTWRVDSATRPSRSARSRRRSGGRPIPVPPTLRPRGWPTTRGSAGASATAGSARIHTAALAIASSKPDAGADPQPEDASRRSATGSSSISVASQRRASSSAQPLRAA